MMNKLPIPGNTIRNIRRGTTAGILALAVTPGLALAHSKGKTSYKLPTQPVSVKARETQRTTERLNKQAPLSFYTGSLVMKVTSETGGITAVDTAGGQAFPNGVVSTTKIVEKPFAIFRGNPKDKFGHNGLSSGDYDFASMDSTGKITVYPFNTETMKLIPSANPDDSTLQNVVFPRRGDGYLDFSQPLSSLKGPGGPYINPGTGVVDPIAQLVIVGSKH